MPFLLKIFKKMQEFLLFNAVFSHFSLKSSAFFLDFERFNTLLGLKYCTFYNQKNHSNKHRKS